MEEGIRGGVREKSVTSGNRLRGQEKILSIGARRTRTLPRWMRPSPAGETLVLYLGTSNSLICSNRIPHNPLMHSSLGCITHWLRTHLSSPLLFSVVLGDPWV